MRWFACILVCAPVFCPAADWRAAAIDKAEAGDVRAAIERAERGRAAWLAPHLARGIPPPDDYIGWVLGNQRILVYRPGPMPAARVIPRPWWLQQAVYRLHAMLAAAEQPPQALLDRLHDALVAPLEGMLDGSQRWIFAPDGYLSRVPFALLNGHAITYAASRRSAALSGLRVRHARMRAPSLFAYARSAPGDPDALPAARAEIELAAAALAAPAFLLSGPGAYTRLQRAAYDGSLGGARYVLFAAHAGPDPAHPGRVQLQLAGHPEARYAPEDTLHLKLNAELVVLSACETGLAVDNGFARAAVIAGAGMTLLTRWRIEDAAAAQFVAALFTEISGGYAVPDALARVRRAFRAGRHGDRYAHPFYWAGWQLWGG